MQSQTEPLLSDYVEPKTRSVVTDADIEAICPEPNISARDADFLVQVSTMVWRGLKTALLASGSVIMDAGNKLLAIPEFYKYYELESSALLLTTKILAMIFAIQANALTRGRAIWLWFDPSPSNTENLASVFNEIKQNYSERSLSVKILCSITAFLATFSAALVIGGRTYSGGTTLLEFFGVRSRLALHSASGYLAFSGIISFFAFSVKIFFRNLFHLADNFGKPVHMRLAWSCFYNAIGRTIGQTMISNLTLRHTADRIGFSEVIGQKESNIFIFSVSLLSVALFSGSRAVDIYKVEKQRLESISSGLNSDLVLRADRARSAKIVINYNYLSGIFYGLFFFMMTAAALLDAEKEVGIPTNPRYMDIVNLVFLALTAALVEYDFIVKKTHKVVS